MQEHATIGSRFVTITNHTTYSFGIDDQEFMTAFECEAPSDFLQLMKTLRETEASRYTERDTPIFVGDRARHPRDPRLARRRVGARRVRLVGPRRRARAAGARAAAGSP